MAGIVDEKGGGIARLRGAGLVWPCVLTLAMMAVLIGLGSWQMQRLTWKLGLVERLQARMRAEPVGIDKVLGRFKDNGDVEYLRVAVKGRFLNGDERYFYAPDQQDGPGYNVVTPLVVLARAGCEDIVLVNRGYVPEARKDPVSRAGGQTEAASVVGLVRLPETPGMFTPANDVKRNLWFWRDISGLAASLPERGAGKACNPAGRAYPFLIDAEREPANAGGWPRGGTTNVTIPNRHLEYALTWFSLAATLAAVFLVYARGRLQRPA